MKRKTTSPRAQALTAALLCSLAGAALAADDAAAVEKVSVRAIAHFNFASNSIDPQDQSRLLAEVGAMKDVSWQTVTATGHTDSVGSAGYNEALGKRRAAAVRAYLLGQGLPAKLVHTASKGETLPVADNGSDEGRAQNRRTEVVFEGVRPLSR